MNNTAATFAKTAATVAANVKKGDLARVTAVYSADSDYDGAPAGTLGVVDKRVNDPEGPHFMLVTNHSRTYYTAEELGRVKAEFIVAAQRQGSPSCYYVSLPPYFGASQDETLALARKAMASGNPEELKVYTCTDPYLSVAGLAKLLNVGQQHTGGLHICCGDGNVLSVIINQGAYVRSYGYNNLSTCE